MSTYDARQYKIGLSGLVLLRNRLKGRKEISKKAVNEIAKFLDSDEGRTREQKIDSYDVFEGYSAWAETYDDYPNLLLEVEEPIVKALIPKTEYGKALDIGCGTGRYSNILSKLGYSVTGVDQSLAMLRKAKSKVHNAKFIRGQITNLPLSDESFDFAICALVLTHSKSLTPAISEINRVVRKGGMIILSDQHPLFIALGGQAVFYDKKGNKGTIREYVHWHSEYLDIFKKLKLKVLECKEPQIDKSHKKSIKGNSTLDHRVSWEALKELPLVLIWVLERS